MDNLNVRVKKFSPFPAAVLGRWGGVFEDEGFFAVLEILSSETFDFALAARTVRETLSGMRGVSQESPLEVLERAAKVAKERVDKLFGADSEGEVDLSFLTLKDGLIYLSSVGKMAPYILREDRPLYLGDNKEIWAKSVLSSPGDRLVILTPSLSEVLPPSLFRSEIPWEGPGGRRKAEVPGAAGLVLDLFETAAEERRFVSGWKEKIPQLLERLRFWRKKPLYVRETPTLRLREKKPVSSALVLFLGVIFLGSVIFTLVRERQRVRGKETAQHLTRAEEEIKSAQDLLGLDSERVAENLAQARDDLSKAEVLGLSKKRAESLRKEIEDLEAKVLKIYPISSNLLYDLGVQGRGAKAQDLVVGEGEDLFVLDRGRGLVFEILVPREGEGRLKVEKFLQNLSSPLGLDYADGVVLTWEVSSVPVFSSEGDLLGKPKLDGSLEVVDTKLYGGNIYLLSSRENQIFKASSFGVEGYSSFSSWLKEAVEIDSNSRMAIDGYIYIWSEGMLKQFARGRETDFSLRGKLKNPIQNPKDIVTRHGAKNIYILDGNLSRVLKFSKDGALLGQFTDSKWGEPDALAVSRDEKRGFVLSGNKIFEFEF